MERYHETEIDNELAKIKKRERRAFRFSIVLITIPIIFVVSLTIYSAKAIKETNNELKFLNHKNDSLLVQNKILSNSLKQLSTSVDSMQEIFVNLNDSIFVEFGWELSDLASNDPLIRRESRLANLEVIESLKKQRYVNFDFGIRYYSKKSDPSGLIKSLKRCRYSTFFIHSDDWFGGSRSNQLHYTSSILFEDVRLIAYLMIRAGVGVKEIAPYKSKAKEYTNTVEISSEPLLENFPTITVADLKAANSFGDLQSRKGMIPKK